MWARSGEPCLSKAVLDFAPRFDCRMDGMSERDNSDVDAAESAARGRVSRTGTATWYSPGMRLWLSVAQLVTVVLSLWWIVSVFQPQWLGGSFSEQQAGGAAGRYTGLGLPIRDNVTVQEAATPDFRTAARVAAKAVVSINVSKAVDNPYRNDPWFQFFYGDRMPEQQTSVGSGVIVDARGYVLTNNHVIEGANAIEVQLSDSRVVPVQLVGSDPDSDIAVLHLQQEGLAPLPVMKWGDAKQAQVGDWVLAIGNPFGVGQTVTSGIVSGLGRSSLGLSTFENFIQTDAAINPGNSGGALVDVRGRLLGINTAIFSRSGASVGIGFAIPENLARQVMADIIDHGYVRRGWIGVEPHNVTEQLAEVFDLQPDAVQRQVVVVSVLRDGPAYRGGMRPGDVVLAVEKQTVRTVAELLNLTAALKPGEQAGVTVLRGTERLTLTLVPALRPPRSG